MKRAVFLILALGLAVAAIFWIRAAYDATESWWLALYLVLAVAMPLIVNTARIGLGVQGIKGFFRALFSTLLGLLVVTLVYQYVTENWLWACLSGLAVLAGMAMARQWTVMNAQSRLAQADQLLRDGKPQAAIEVVQEVRSIFVKKGNREGQALAEWIMGMGYAGINDNVRAARYLNSARALLKALNKEEQIQKVDEELANLRARGVDVGASAVVAEASDEIGRIDWGFLMDGILSIACSLALLQIWEVSVFRTSLGFVVALGALLLLLVYGNYAIVLLASPGQKHQTTLPLIIYNLALVLLATGIAGLLMVQGTVAIADSPEAIQGAVLHFESLVTGWPDWVLPAIVAFSLIMIFADVVLASGRSPAGLVRALSRGDVSRQALELAVGYMDSGNWREAIVQLTRIDLLEVKDVGRRKEVLFCLAYVHCQAEHSDEAKQYMVELLSEDPRHLEGLYLAGYMALKDGQLEQAERSWRSLYQAAPGFRLLNASSQQSAAHYLSLTLYRRAMQIIDMDLDAGTKLLAEISEMHTLDREVADALVRVHLYRAAGLIRQRELDSAARELALSKDKLQYLQGLVGDKEEIAKLTGLYQAALGLVAFKREQYNEARTGFGQAISETKDLMPKQPLLTGTGQSFLEQLLRMAFQDTDKDGKGRIGRSFGRDLYFLASVSIVHVMQEELAESAMDGARRQKLSETLTTEVEQNLQRSLDIQPDFVEARALLGLLYYHIETDKAKREKGIEILQTVRKQVGSRFVAETVVEYEEQQKRKVEAREAYFDLLQQYLRSASVPIKEREGLRKQVLDDMKATGEYESFMGRSSLEVNTEREREPTVKEYAARAALLAEKIENLRKLDKAGQLPQEIGDLMEQLKKRNEILVEHINGIAEVEKKLLLQAQQLL